MSTESAPASEASLLIPARMINEYVYCPRLCYLEWVQGEFADSADTIMGRQSHRRVDDGKGLPPDSEEKHEFESRSVYLSAPEIGVVTVIDLVEGAGKDVIPVDYKKGAVPDLPEKSYEPDRVQMCAMGLVLRENGYNCDHGLIYYVKSKSKVRIDFEDSLIEKTKRVISEIREMSRGGAIPPPLEDSPKCPGCSLAGICLPDESRWLEMEKKGDSTGEVRRLYPARDDAFPVYVQEQGSHVGKDGEEIVIKKDGEVRGRSRLVHTSQLCIFGSVQVSTQLVHEMCRRGIPICYFSYGSWFNGITQGMAHKNVELRMRQFDIAAKEEESIQLARRFIEGKIRNCRTLLRRNSKEVSKPAMKELMRLARLASHAPSSGELLGIEGSAGRVYFLHFGDMLKSSYELEFDFNSRNRRPPTDPVNALLSYLYSILAKDATVTLLEVGFDPFLGFYHKPRYGRPSLALDVMEEFRPLICDSVTIGLINTEEIHPDNFIKRGNAVSLTPKGKRIALGAYERRMDTLISHPVFGYSISYRRVLEVQSRLISRYLLGELDEYPIFCTR